MKQFRPYVVFSDIMKCFYVSCSMELLIIFFTFGEFHLTGDIIKQSVCSIFVILIIFLASYQFFLRKRWFSSVPIESELSAEVLKGINVRENADISEYNRKVSAVHEAGHAVMAYLKEIEDFYVLMSYIQPKVVTIQKQQKAEEVKNMILIKYAGAVAEELLFGYFHAGCWMGTDSDFNQATFLLKGYIAMVDLDVSKSLLEDELSEKITYLSKKMWNETVEILSEKKEMIERLSENLMRKGALNKRQIEKILKEID